MQLDCCGTGVLWYWSVVVLGYLSVVVLESHVVLQSVVLREVHLLWYTYDAVLLCFCGTEVLVNCSSLVMW